MKTLELAGYKLVEGEVDDSLLYGLGSLWVTKSHQITVQSAFIELSEAICKEVQRVTNDVTRVDVRRFRNSVDGSSTTTHERVAIGDPRFLDALLSLDWFWGTAEFCGYRVDCLASRIIEP